MARSKKHKTVGYLRVSTNSQDLEKNKADILSLANSMDLGKVEFVKETVSSRVSWKKRKLAAVVDGVNKGDNIVVSELSRLTETCLSAWKCCPFRWKKASISTR